MAPHNPDLWNEPPHALGRPPACEPTADDLRKLRAVYLKTNAGRDRGSKYLAARILARNGELSEPVAEAILKPRRSKCLPKKLRDEMTVPLDMIRHHRAPSRQRLSGFYVPGRLRMTRTESGELRRLFPGERQSWDDATLNFGVVVPWPWGGDRCSDRFGVRVVRAQLLVCVDDSTDFCPGFSYVIRDKQAYRAEDTVAAQFRLWRDQYAPERAMLEGGAWQSGRARAWLEAAGVGIEDATGRPHNKLVEGWFNRLWTVLSMLPGQVGRWRGEMERENEIYLKCRDGRADPRPHFPDLLTALREIELAIAELNSTPVESDLYGTWVPQERHRDGLAERPRPRVSPELAVYAAPVVEERVIRRNMVRITCDGPFGSFPYHFADESLWEFEGARVRIYFDPWDSPLRACITLARDWQGLKEGTVICREALCLDDAPEVLAALDGLVIEASLEAEARALEMRRRIAEAIRREYRALGFGGRRVAAASEMRGPDKAGKVDVVNGRQTENTERKPEGFAGLRRRSLSESDVERITAEADALEEKLRGTGLLM